MGYEISWVHSHHLKKSSSTINTRSWCVCVSHQLNLTIMGRFTSPPAPPPTPPAILDNGLADFLVLSTPEIKNMCMFFFLWMIVAANQSKTVKDFASCLLASAGGGILIPIFLNDLPVFLKSETFLVYLMANFLLFKYLPGLRDLTKGSTTLLLFASFCAETFRANAVCAFVTAGMNAVGGTGEVFSFPLFAPIICGTLGGCGGGFFPLSKGLAPLDNGLNSKQRTALVGAIFFHLYTQTQKPLSAELAVMAGKMIVSVYFIFVAVSAELSQPTFIAKAKAS